MRGDRGWWRALRVRRQQLNYPHHRRGGPGAGGGATVAGGAPRGAPQRCPLVMRGARETLTGHSARFYFYAKHDTGYHARTYTHFGESWLRTVVRYRTVRTCADC